MKPEDTTSAVAPPLEQGVGRPAPERAVLASSKEGQEAWAYWMCPTKPGYSTISKAKQAARDSLSGNPEVTALYGYKCAHCRRFHLTRKRNRHGPLATLKTPIGMLSGQAGLPA